MKNVLIVEVYHHPTVLENLYHLLNNKCELKFFINKDKQESFDLLFPSNKKSKVLINPFHSSTIFIWVLFIGHKFDYINVTTGPEGSHWSEIANIIFFYICCLLYKDKIILTIKNVRSYLKSTPGLLSCIRYKSIKKLNRFTFETETIKKNFLKNFDNKSCLTSVSYDRYSDLLKIDHDEKVYTLKDGFTRIGLLGVIDSERRNYNVITDVFKKMNKETLSNFRIVVLGACFGGKANDTIKKLAKYVNVECKDGLLSGNEFEEIGLRCDCFLAPLRKELEYGSYKGTGAISDAIYLRKNLILPKHVDQYREFEEICFYYENKDELLNIFNNLNILKKRKITTNFSDQFTTDFVFNNLLKDLEIKHS